MMSNVVAIQKNDVLYDPKTINLIRRTVAADTNDDEFNLFVNMARSLGLDPLRRQIYAFVFSKNNPQKRRLSIIVSIDGFRSIAESTGNYRPDEDEAVYEINDSLKSPLNPLGIVKATVRVWKYSHGDWHRVTGVAYWDEYAPIKDEWGYDEASGKNRPTGKKTLDDSGQWVKMPRVMLAKCAEAQALRKAWPDNFANVYESSEIDRAKVIDMLPAEAAEQGAVAERQQRIGHVKEQLNLCRLERSQIARWRSYPQTARNRLQSCNGASKIRPACKNSGRGRRQTRWR
jgi:phage recombination protein Bet